MCLVALRNKKGFTVLELLIVIAIGIAMASMAIPIYGGLQTRAQSEESAAQMVQVLRTAKVRAEGGFNDVSHGVYFDINAASDDRYILYQGGSYATRVSSYDQTFVLMPVLSIENIDLSLTGSDIDINFLQGNSEPNNIGEFRINHESDNSKIVEIRNFGKIDYR